MAKKIYKYELGVDGDVVTIKNCFSRIIKVMAQNGWPYIWMEIDEENYDESEINITAIGTTMMMPVSMLILLSIGVAMYGITLWIIPCF